MKKRMVVTGLSGAIGKVLLDEKPKNIEIFELFHKRRRLKDNNKCFPLNLINRKSISSALMNISPDVIVHLAAVTHIDVCEKDKANGKRGKVWQINVNATKEIARFAYENKISLIFLSTECVFNGNKKYFHEGDKKNPINWYGVSKSAAEDEVLASGAKAAIIRSVAAYSKQDRLNTLYGLIKSKLNENKKLRVVADQLFTPTDSRDIVKAIYKIYEKKLTGVFHVAPNPSISPYDFAQVVAKKEGYSKNLILKTTLIKYFGIKSASLRLKNSSLYSKKSSLLLGFKPKNAKKAVREF